MSPMTATDRQTTTSKHLRAGRILRLALATAAFTCLTAVSAPSALADLGWRDADPGDAIPTAVDLADVASAPDGSRIVAVGTDTTSHEVVIFHHTVEGGWVKDSISGAPQGTLKDVAATSGAAVAVGSKADGTPLMLRLDQSGNTWSPLSGSGGPAGAVLSVALRDKAGFVGDDQGAIYPVNADTGTVSPPVNGAGSSKPINGITLYSASDGFAVGDRGETNVTSGLPVGDPSQPNPTTPIFKFVEGQGFAPDTTEQNTNTLQIAAVSALGAHSATAVDGGTGPGAYWQPDSTGVWHHLSLADAGALRDASMGASDGNVVTAIAGANASGAPTVWRRAGTSGSWTEDSAPAQSSAPLRGVAALNPTDIYAVGDRGTVIRYWDKPATTSTGSNGGNNGGSNGGSDGGTGSCSCTYLPPPSTNTKPVDEGPDVIVEQPKPGSKPGGQPRPLMSDVAVRRGKKTLIIGFRLRKRARVAVTVKRKSHVLAHMALKTFSAGRHRVVLHYRSKRPPTRLKIVVKNAGK